MGRQVVVGLLMRRSKVEVKMSYYRDKEEHTRKEEICNMVNHDHQ